MELEDDHFSRFGRNLRQEVTSKAKYYFLDTGIRNALIAQFSGSSQARRMRLAILQVLPILAILFVLVIQQARMDFGLQAIAMRRPQIVGQPDRMDGRTLLGKVFTDASDVPGKDAVCVAILLRIDGLGKIDQADLSFPIQDIVSGEITMHAMLGQHAVDVK
jgi:hypothetical protein